MMISKLKQQLMLLINYANQGHQRIPNIQVHPPELEMTMTIQKSKDY